jgi:hypothetical protein
MPETRQAASLPRHGKGRNREVKLNHSKFGTPLRIKRKYPLKTPESQKNFIFWKNNV